MPDGSSSCILKVLSEIQIAVTDSIGGSNPARLEHGDTIDARLTGLNNKKVIYLIHGECRKALGI